MSDHDMTKTDDHLVSLTIVALAITVLFACVVLSTE
jgi:hypothetical protein